MARVLVVEDDPWIQWMIADDLVDRGHEVVTAQDGVQALKRTAHDRPDVIVLDLMLPRSSGWAFIEQYQTVTDGEAIPIVVVSAIQSPSLPRAPGAFQRYLAKPFDIEELARNVDELSRREAVTRPIHG